MCPHLSCNVTEGKKITHLFLLIINNENEYRFSRSQIINLIELFISCYFIMGVISRKSFMPVGRCVSLYSFLSISCPVIICKRFSSRSNYFIDLISYSWNYSLLKPLYRLIITVIKRVLNLLRCKKGKRLKCFTWYLLIEQFTLILVNNEDKQTDFCTCWNSTVIQRPAEKDSHVVMD